MTAVAAFPGLAEQEDVRTLYIHDLAADTIRKMFEQCRLIRETYGPGQEYQAAVDSLHAGLSALLGRGFCPQAYVTKDIGFSSGPGLSLYVQEGDAFVFGMVWFRRRCDDGTDRAGIAGEWSLHS